jgi:hypothetical protein
LDWNETTALGNDWNLRAQLDDKSCCLRAVDVICVHEQKKNVWQTKKLTQKQKAII